MTEYGCTDCGKPFREMDKAVGTAKGFIRESKYGFAPLSSGPWEDVLCPDCQKRRHKLIHETAPKMQKLLAEALSSLESNVGVQDVYVDYDGVDELKEKIEAIIAEGKEVKDEQRG